MNDTRDELIDRLRNHIRRLANPLLMTDTELVEFYDAVSQEITRRDIRQNSD